MYPIYRDITNWIILNEQVIHDFGDLEQPIDIVNVLIGTLHFDRIGLDGRLEHARTPITRWMTRIQYYKYNED